MLPLASLVLTLIVGCAGSHSMVGGPAETPSPAVAQILAIWNNQVITGVDPAHNGAPMCGLAGRVYLCGAGMREFVLADGKLVVELYGPPPPGQPQGAPVRMEVWEIKKELLNSGYKRNDGVGQGYSLSLPWPSYRPDIAQVQMRVHYEADKGGIPVYAAESTVTLNSGPAATPMYSHRAETGSGQPIVMGPPPGPVLQPGMMPPPQPGAAPPPATGPVQQAGFQPQPALMPWQQPQQPAAQQR